MIVVIKYEEESLVLKFLLKEEEQMESSVRKVCHAKAILLGEHSVVYGYPAFAIPLPSITLSISVSPSLERTITTIGYEGYIDNIPDTYGGIKYLIDYFSKGRKENFHLQYTSIIPFSKGMGSSAASSLATARALNEYFKKGLKEEEILDLATFAENIVHGKASGLDLATVNSEYPILFRQGQKTPIKNHLNGFLVIGDTGILKNTKRAVGLVKEELTHDPSYQTYIDNLGEITERGVLAYQHQDIKELGKMFDECQENLRNLNVSCAEIENLIVASKKAGALGAKLSGGGLGGIVLSLAGNLKTADAIQKEMIRAGASATWLERI